MERHPLSPNDPRLVSFWTACEQISDREQTETIDPYYRQAAVAMRLEASPGGCLEGPLLEAFDAHEARGFPLSPYTMVHLVCRALNFYAIQGHVPGYPQNFGPNAEAAHVQAWRDLMATAVSDPEFQHLINYRTINSTVPERTRGIEIVASLFPERFEEAHGLDIGANFGLLHRSLADVRLRTAAGLELTKNNGVIDNDLTLSLLGRLAVAELQRPLIGPSLGIDIVDCRHPSITTWVRNCSLTPSELDPKRHRQQVLNEHMVAESEYADRLVHFAVADIFKQNERNFPPQDFLQAVGRTALPRHSGFKFNFASALTVGYLFDETRQHDLIDQMMHFTTDDGLLFIQDCCQIDATAPAPHNIVYESNIYQHPWQYRLLAYDKLQEDAGWQELMTFRTPRCLQARLGNGRLRVGNETFNIADRIAA